MAQHDYSIANQSGASFRSDLNNALSAIVSQNSGTSEPSTMYAYQMWADTTNGVMKLRNSANNAWITLYQLDGEYSTIALENGTAAAPSIYFKDSGTDTGIFSGGTDQVCVSTGGVERGRFDSSGRFLVGTSSARSGYAGGNNFTPYLQVEGNSDGTRFYSLTNNSNANAVSAPILNLSRSRSSSIGGTTVVQNGDWLGTISFNGYDGTNPVEAVQIKAEVDGTPGTNDMPGRLVFSTTKDGLSSPTERMIIKNNGNILIGTTTDLGALICCESWGTGIKVGEIWNHTSSIPSGSADVISFNYQGTSVGKISITTTATTYATSSDYRLKENVIAITNGITRLQQLKPSRFNFIADPAQTFDGFIAHEVQTVVPEAITGEKDEVDDDGNPQYQGIDQSKLVPLLTAALQEAIGEIESLKARVAALESA